MPRLLVVDDDALILSAVRLMFSEVETEVLTADTPETAIRYFSEQQPDAVLVDIRMPGMSGLELYRRLRQLDARTPVIFATGQGTSDTAIEAMRLGAFDYVLKPFEPDQLIELVEKAFEISRLMRVPARLVTTQEDDPSGNNGDVFIGQSPAMQTVYKEIGRVAGQNVTVLIRGESGTGKELVARAIYQYSDRAAELFQALNCAAIPETLLESELFGHEKGSFTGADRRRIGKFEQCHGGTLFLDEIGDMPLVLQSKLLRLLQEQRFERVGGTETIETDVRLIAATHRDLEAMIEDGEFRADLYYRLNVFQISLPPLRERMEDLPRLVDHFLHRASVELKRDVNSVGPDTLRRLSQYDWPGNIRELQSIIRQAILKTIGPVLTPQFLPECLNPGHDLRAAAAGVENTTSHSPAVDQWLEFVDSRIAAGSQLVHQEAMSLMERRLLTHVLRHTSGNQVEASSILGIARPTLRRRIRDLGISIDRVIDSTDAVG